MNLINAETFPDKLKEMMIQIDKNMGEPEEDWFLNGFDEFVIALDVINLVKEMPTVNAIPVDWIKAQLEKEEYRAFLVDYIEWSNCLRWLLEKWEKENEMR